jgi:hypothetical protein
MQQQQLLEASASCLSCHMIQLPFDSQSAVLAKRKRNSACKSGLRHLAAQPRSGRI